MDRGSKSYQLAAEKTKNEENKIELLNDEEEALQNAEIAIQHSS